MTYKVPGYAEVSHFHAPYKDSLEPGVMASSYVSGSASVSSGSKAPSGRRYDEISHFRAPYKDSMMGFGATQASAVSPTTASASKSGITRPLVSRPISPILKAPQQKTPGFQEIPKTDLPKQPMPDILARSTATYFAVNLLNYEASIVEYGPDPRTWSSQTPRIFEQMWKTKTALILNKDSKWRQAYRSTLLDLFRTYEEKSVRSVQKYIEKMLAEEAIGPATSSFGIQLTTTQSFMTPTLAMAIEDALNADYVGSLAFAEDGLFSEIQKYNAATGAKLRPSRPSRVPSRVVADSQKKAEESLKKAQAEVADLKKQIEELKKSQQAEVEAEQEIASAATSFTDFFKKMTLVHYLVGAAAIGAGAYLIAKK